MHLAKIGRNLIKGPFCELDAIPLMTTFVGNRRILVPAKSGIIIGDDVTLGTGVIINHGVKRPTTIGDRVYIWHKSVVGHDCIIEDDVVVGVGVCISGEVRIGEYSYIGVGSVISPRVSIGKYCMIGAGSNVIHDTVIPDGEVWCGNPAKKLRLNEWRPPT